MKLGASEEVALCVAMHSVLVVAAKSTLPIIAMLASTSVYQMDNVSVNAPVGSYSRYTHKTSNLVMIIICSI